jgi:8-oxo-dGTP pyrophosphatase MutT (NUDIX family)
MLQSDSLNISYMPGIMRMKFHYKARGIIVVDGYVLLAHQIGAGNTFLPGGQIESGEGAESALVREIYEEIGKKATVKRFVGAVEHMFPEDRLDNHELNLVFEVEIPELDTSKPPQSLEDHIEFIWSEPSALERHNLQPYPLIECLTNWNADLKAYWGTTFDDSASRCQ